MEQLASSKASSSFFNDLEKMCSETSFSKKAFELLLKKGLPDEKSELFKYLPLEKVYSKEYIKGGFKKKDFSSLVYEECQKSFLVFINGVLSLELSNLSGVPKGVILLPKSEADNIFSSLILSSEEKILTVEKDPFALLSYALSNDPLIIYVPPKTVFLNPLQIIHIYTEEKGVSSSGVFLFMGKESELKVIENKRFEDESEGAFQIGSIQLFLEERARVDFYRHIEFSSSKATCFEALRGHLKRGSFLQTVNVNLPFNQAKENLFRDDYQVYLKGEEGEVSLNGVWSLNENNQSHTHVRVDHMAENCQSLQLFKGVLRDFSKSSFEGKIFVEKEAQKTNAFQLNNNLLLSERAESFSKPNLEIFADDVKASHGSTTGPCDEEELFYLKTRGISLAKGQELLVKGFTKEVIEHLPLIMQKRLFS